MFAENIAQSSVDLRRLCLAVRRSHEKTGSEHRSKFRAALGINLQWNHFFFYILSQLPHLNLWLSRLNVARQKNEQCLPKKRRSRFRMMHRVRCNVKIKCKSIRRGISNYSRSVLFLHGDFSQRELKTWF